MESLATISNNHCDLRIESKGVAAEIEEKCDSASNSSFFLRKIEFHPARKQFNGFGSNCMNKSDLRIETLRPDSGRTKLPGSNLNVSESASSSSVKRVDGSDLVENGLDPELTFGITFRKIGAGLENLGNTCFLNSVLQCLTYTEPLAAYLQSGKHQTSCHVAGFCALCAIQKHVSRALQSTGRSLVPKDLVSNLRCISRNFRNARQEDAHEYMVNLLESMHKCCLPSGVPSESPAAYEKSLVHKIFGGRLRSQVECQQCSFCSNKFDPFLDLSLEIVKADSLPVALRNFTAAELLDGGEKHYQCQKCKQKVRAKKRLTVHNAPNVLTIHLKRFHAHDPGRKVDKKVLFDRSLDMKPFISGSYEGDVKYSLYGVLVHYGHSTHSGHYVCFVRTSSGIWHLLNDNEVRPVSEKVVLDQKAYMLFYVRDRKHVAPNRPSNVFRKENMKATVSNNLANLVSKQMPKEQAIGNKCEIEKTPQKGALDQPLVSECSSDKAKPIAGSPLPRNPSKEVSQNPDLGACLLPSALSLNGKCNTAKVDKESSNCNDTQNSPVEKLVPDESLEKFNLVVNVRVGGGIEKAPGHTQADFSHRVNSEIVSVKSPVKPNSGSSLGGSLPHHRTLTNLSGDEAGDCVQRSVNELAEPSIPSVTPNDCSHEKAPDTAPHKKSRKLLKCRISNMPLGLKFFRASLGLRKRKKHKKSKRHTLGAHDLIGAQLLEGASSSLQLGTATSKMYMPMSLHLKNSQRKKAKPYSKCGSDSLLNNVDEEFKKRNNQDGEAVPMDKLLKSSISTHEVKQNDASEFDCRKTMRKQMPENGMMCILTRGLEETTVARWDGVESSKSQIVESSSENLHIGHVLDEWDEEYDRGKRKKVRQNKHDFGGPNPFQELASKKMQFKKAKMDRSSSGNKPFRI